MITKGYGRLPLARPTGVRMMGAPYWKAVPGFERRYMVSREGVVKSVQTGHVLAGGIDRYGYRYVNLSVDGVVVKRKVHRLVCEAFHGPANGLHCAHWDGDKLNNRASNLRWATARENARDSQRHGTLKPPPPGLGGRRRGVKHPGEHPGAKLSEEQAREIRHRRANGEEGKALAAEFGVHPSTVCRIAKSERWGPL